MRAYSLPESAEGWMGPGSPGNATEAAHRPTRAGTKASLGLRSQRLCCLQPSGHGGVSARPRPRGEPVPPRGPIP